MKPAHMDYIDADGTRRRVTVEPVGASSSFEGAITAARSMPYRRSPEDDVDGVPAFRYKETP